MSKSKAAMDCCVARRQFGLSRIIKKRLSADADEWFQKEQKRLKRRVMYA